jgi:DNA-directed RNA polymerase specialized sigma24 family protein
VEEKKLVIDAEMARSYVSGVLCWVGDEDLRISVADIRRAFETFDVPPVSSNPGYAFVSGRNAAAEAARKSKALKRKNDVIRSRHTATVEEITQKTTLKDELFEILIRAQEAGVPGDIATKFRIFSHILSGGNCKQSAQVLGISQGAAHKHAQRGRVQLKRLGASDALLDAVRICKESAPEVESNDTDEE